MEFKEAEERFYELKGRLDAGAISQEEFKAQLEGLKVRDSQGRYWMIGVQSGKWYFYDGTRWIRAEPPGEAGEAPTSEGTPRGPAASMPEQLLKSPTSIKLRPHRRGISGALLALIPLGLILACCPSIIAVGAADYLISSHPISSALSDLLGRQIGFIATPTPTLPLEESPTPTITATPSAVELIALGDQLVFQGQLEEAIAQYQMATAVDSQNALAYLKLGETYLALGRCEEAIPKFQQALVIDPHLAAAQEGLRKCAGPPPPRVTFASYVRADLGLSILYPETWVLAEEENQTIFFESEEALEHLAGSVFIFASLPLETEMTNAQALEERIATLPPGTQVGEMEPAYISGQEWASVHAEMSGETVPLPSRVYIAATVWHSRLYALWALAPTDTWKDVAWPIFQAMVKTVKIQEVMAEAPIPTPTPTATPTATPTPAPEGPGVYWLSRPIGPQGEQHVDRFYPYGSTGRGKYRIHHGVEFQNEEGTPVLAAASGRVIVAGRDDEVIYGAKPNFYGQLVIVELEKRYRGEKLYNLYAHLSQIDVEVGQTLEEGDIVGRVGMSGSAFGPHLHFEVRLGENTYDRTLNPELWLRPLPGCGIIVGRLVDAQGKPIPETLIIVHHAESPEQRWQEISTYPLEEVNPDEEWGENFVLGDVPEGTYILKTRVGGKLYQREVVVVDGEIVLAIMKTD